MSTGNFLSKEVAEFCQEVKRFMPITCLRLGEYNYPDGVYERYRLEAYVDFMVSTRYGYCALNTGMYKIRVTDNTVGLYDIISGNKWVEIMAKVEECSCHRGTAKNIGYVEFTIKVNRPSTEVTS